MIERRSITKNDAMYSASVSFFRESNKR